MVPDKRRRKALARAKWERQQARRDAVESRNRTLRIAGGAVAGVVVLGLAGWGVVSLATGSGSPGDGTTTPTYTDNFPSMLQPSSPGLTISSYSPSSSTTGTKTGATTGTTKGTTTAPTTAITTQTTGGSGQ